MQIHLAMIVLLSLLISCFGSVQDDIRSEIIREVESGNEYIDYEDENETIVDDLAIDDVYMVLESEKEVLDRSVCNPESFVGVDLLEATLNQDMWLLECALGSESPSPPDIDLKKVDNDGNTAMHIATSLASGRSVKLLLENGANVNAQNNEGLTPLMIAVTFGFIDMVKLLVSSDDSLNVDLQDTMGNTALILAIAYEYEKIAEFLIENAADLSIKNKEGTTAIELATQFGFLRVRDALVNAGASDSMLIEEPFTEVNYEDIKKKIIQDNEATLARLQAEEEGRVEAEADAEKAKAEALAEAIAWKNEIKNNRQVSESKKKSTEFVGSKSIEDGIAIGFRSPVEVDQKSNSKIKTSESSDNGVDSDSDEDSESISSFNRASITSEANIEPLVESSDAKKNAGSQTAMSSSPGNVEDTNMSMKPQIKSSSVDMAQDSMNQNENRKSKVGDGSSSENTDTDADLVAGTKENVEQLMHTSSREVKIGDNSKSTDADSDTATHVSGTIESGAEEENIGKTNSIKPSKGDMLEVSEGGSLHADSNFHNNAVSRSKFTSAIDAHVDDQNVEEKYMRKAKAQADLQARIQAEMEQQLSQKRGDQKDL